MANRILENFTRIKRLVGILIYPLAEYRLAKDGIGVRRNDALDLPLDIKGQAGGGGYSWGIRNRGCQCYSRREGDGRGERDGGSYGDGWGLRGSWCRWKKTVSYRFCPTTHDKGQNSQDDSEKE